MKSELTGAVLPPLEDYQTWVPSRHRRAFKAWRSWKKWSAFDPVPVLGVFLFAQALIGLAFLRGSEKMFASYLCEKLEPFIFGDDWWIGLVVCFAAAFVLAVIWKKMMIRFHYRRCTTKWRRSLGLDPCREPIIGVL